MVRALILITVFMLGGIFGAFLTALLVAGRDDQ